MMCYACLMERDAHIVEKQGTNAVEKWRLISPRDEPIISIALNFRKNFLKAQQPLSQPLQPWHHCWLLFYKQICEFIRKRCKTKEERKKGEKFPIKSFLQRASPFHIREASSMKIYYSFAYAWGGRTHSYKHISRLKLLIWFSRSLSLLVGAFVVKFWWAVKWSLLTCYFNLLESWESLDWDWLHKAFIPSAWNKLLGGS